MNIYTESGACYEIVENRLRRTAPVEMRRDEEWLDIIDAEPITVGNPMVLVIQVLDKPVATVRVTTPVIRIED